nr:polysialyltransferase family glycosyltransferase [uncultured Blautia sp.]
MKDVMKLSTQGDLLKYLQSREQINFIALCASNFQAIGIDVIIEILQKEGKLLNGIILMLTDNYLSFQFSHFAENIDYIEYENKLDKNINYYRLNIIKYLSSFKHKDLYFVSITISYTWYTFLNLYNKNSRLKWIIIEDGVGNYLKKGLEKTYLYNKLCGDYYKAFIFGVIKSSLIWFEDRIIQTREITLLDKNNRRQVNHMIKELYCKEIRKRKQIVERLNNIKDLICNDAIFLIEFSRIDIDSKMAEYNLVKDICDFFKSRHVNYFIKPHPRECNINIYRNIGNVFESNNNISLEMLLGNMERTPRVIIGTISSCLYIANALYGIKTISLGKILLQSTEFKNLGMRRVIKEFIKKFDKIVYFPETISELYDLI